MLTIHHLGESQSERIVWLCEELGLDYTLVHHTRDPKTRLSPPSLLVLHPLGAAPVLMDDGLVLAESGAVVEYIMGVYGDGRLAIAPGQPHYADYLYWFHFANGGLQPVMGRCMIVGRAGLPEDHPLLVSVMGRRVKILDMMEARLGSVDYLAGPFTAADIMTVFSLTTMRLFSPLDLSPYPNILAYLQRIGVRPAYRRAMEKGDPGFTPMLT